MQIVRIAAEIIVLLVVIIAAVWQTKEIFREGVNSIDEIMPDQQNPQCTSSN